MAVIHNQVPGNTFSDFSSPFSAAASSFSTSGSSFFSSALALPLGLGFAAALAVFVAALEGAYNNNASSVKRTDKCSEIVNISDGYRALKNNDLLTFVFSGKVSESSLCNTNTPYN